MIASLIVIGVVFFILQSQRNKSNDFISKIFFALIQIAMIVMLIHLVAQFIFFRWHTEITNITASIPKWIKDINLQAQWLWLALLSILLLWVIAKATKGGATSIWMLPFRLIFMLFKLLRVIFDGIIYQIQAKNSYHYGRAKFLSWWKRLFLLNPWNKGLSLDGKRFISEKNSYEHHVLIAPTGAGKSVNFLLNDLLLKTKRNRSIVVTDPSGELMKVSSEYLKKQGFHIKVLDVVNHRNFYNPLVYAQDSYTRISELVEVIIDSNLSQGNSSEPFWEESAKSITVLLTTALLKAHGKQSTLAMVLDHLNLLGIPKNKQINQLMAEQLNEKDFNAFKAFVSQDEKLKSSVLATAKSALHKFNDPSIEKLTSEDTMDFENLRQQKTIVFLIIPEHRQDYFKFLATLFYTQLFDIAMNADPKDKSVLPLYFLLDEAGNLGRINTLKTIITAGRKRKISVSLILQSLKQLEGIYGGYDSKVIFNNCNNKVVYGGLAVEETEVFSKTIGQTTVMKTNEPWRLKNLFQARKRREMGTALLSAVEIRTLAKDKALFICGNRSPVLMKTKPYFKNRRLLRRLRGNSKRVSFKGLWRKVKNYFLQKK